MLRSLRVVNLVAKKCYNIPKALFLRTYLSAAYNCDDAWNKRLESPYIKKIKLGDIFYEIEHQFLHFGKASALDIDLFTNAIDDETHSDEVEDVIHKLRLSPEAGNLLPSTQHALIRLLIAFGNVDELLRVLEDRVNYGIFMDDYSCILLLNKFLKENNYKYAARVATIQMLQEDFSHPIVKYMSLFACHKFSLKPETWVPKEEKLEDKDNKFDGEDDDEEVRVRVRYIRNPFFDDHFDLRNPNHLVGKTLWMIGNEIPDALGRSYTLIGYTLHEKWDKLQEYIQYLVNLKDKPVIYKGSIDIIKNMLQQDSKESAESKTQETSSSHNDKINEILNSLAKLETSNLVTNDNFLKITEDRMKEAISNEEINTINNQLKAYEDWDKLRVKLINEHIEKLKRDKALAEIQQTKEQLKAKEEELFFFENENELDVTIGNKSVRYPKKWLGKKKQKKIADSEYIPPEIEKKHPSVR